MIEDISSASVLDQDNWLINTPIAHRGYHSNSSEIPENSLDSFKNAIEFGFPIELDIHVLADNKVVVFHDKTLQRMCGFDIPIVTLSSNDLENYKLLKSNCKIPLLKDVFNLVGDRVPILIELKNSGRAGEFEWIVSKELLAYKGKYAIQSFNPFSLNWFVKKYPGILRGQLSGTFTGEGINSFNRFLLKNFAFNFISKPQFIGYESTDIPNKRIMKFKKDNIPVLAWTVRNAIEYDRIRPFVHNIIFENFRPGYE